MKHSSRSWNYYVRLCSSMNVDSGETYRKGKEFLLYYRETCRMPEAMLPPDLYETQESRLRQYRMLDSLLRNSDPSDFRRSLGKEKLSLRMVKDITTETMDNFTDMGEDYRLYASILEKKYMALNHYTDGDIMEIVNIGTTAYYNHLKEGTALFIMHLWRVVLPKRQQELQYSIKENGMHPEEVVYG